MSTPKKTADPQNLFSRMFADAIEAGKVGGRLAEAKLEAAALCGAVAKLPGIGDKYKILFSNPIAAQLEPFAVTQALKAAVLVAGDRLPEAIAQGLIQRCDRVAVLAGYELFSQLGAALVPMLKSIAVEAGVVDLVKSDKK